MAEETVKPCAPSSALPSVRWFTLEVAEEAVKWAVHREVAAALGVSPRSLRQWMAPRRDFRSADVSDRLRVVPHERLPPSLRSKRGLLMIAESAVREYTERVRGRHGQKRRTELPADQIEALCPLRRPDLPVVTDTAVVLNDTAIPRDAFVCEWMEPLARQLGYALVPLPQTLSLPAASSSLVPPPSAAAPTAEKAPINVCVVKRKKVVH